MRYRLVSAGVTVLALWFAAPAGLAQSVDELRGLREEIEALRQGQSAIQDQLKAIHELVQQGQQPRQVRQTGAAEPVELVLRGMGDDPYKGDAEAELMLIEFSDYQCPFCRRHFITTVPQLDREYLQTGMLKYVVRDFPLESIHPYAAKAAEAANCAGEQGKYWEMHDRLFTETGQLAPAQMQGHAEAVGLNMAAFAECFISGKYAEEVREDMADGSRAGVAGTPTFFLAVAGGEPGTAKTLVKIRGAQPYAVFKEAIDKALAELEKVAHSG